MAQLLEELTSLIAEHEAKKFDTTVTKSLREMVQALEGVVAGTASNPAALRQVQDKTESARKACSDKVEDLDRIELIRQLQQERKYTEAMLKFTESAKSRLPAVEQVGTVAEDMVLVEKDETLVKTV